MVIGGVLAASACASTGDIETQATVDAAIAIVATAEAGDLSTSVPTPDSGEAAVPAGALGLVTDKAIQVTIWNVDALRNDAPGDLENKFEDEWKELERYEIFVDDLTSIVETTDPEGATVVIVEGRLAWQDIRGTLGAAGFEESTYRGQEMWEDGTEELAFALLEDRGQIVKGPTPGVRDVLRSLSRGTGFLQQDADHNLVRVLGKAGDGWVVLLDEECESIVAGCRAMAEAVSTGVGSTVVFRWALLFQSESTAESELDAVEDYFDEAFPKAMSVESVEQTAAFVVVVMSAAEEFFAPPSGDDGARRAEFHDLSVAVTALMVENNLSRIPNPVSANTAPCATGTQDMAAYPDTASTVATADKLNDPSENAYSDGVDPLGDLDGYVLFGHDITGDNAQSALVNYINFDNTTYCYTVDTHGTVHQYDLAGLELEV